MCEFVCVCLCVLAPEHADCAAGDEKGACCYNHLIVCSNYCLRRPLASLRQTRQTDSDLEPP